MTVVVAAPAPSGSKGFFEGTHRACTPEETWSRIRPLLDLAGITRVGELTRLDTVGIPVAQAVRPASRTAAVTLGAGLGAVHARVAAAMASLELWHAERVETPPSWSAVGAVRANLGYNPYALPLHRQHLLNDGMVLDWVPATLLRTGRPTMVPRACAEHDLTVRQEWTPPVFLQSGAGLAAGNTHAEAVLHALYEVLARDAVARAQAAAAGERVAVDLTGCDSDDANRLLDRLTAAGLQVTVHDITGPTGVACFEVGVTNPAGASAHGVACHLDRSVALCRALAAAARERMAAVTGARDDLPLSDAFTPTPTAAARTDAPRRRALTEIATFGTASFAGDVAEVSDRLHRIGAGPVLVVDLSRRSVGLPVVRVIVGGLRPSSED